MVPESELATVVAVLLLASVSVVTLHWLIPHAHLVAESGCFRPNLLRSAYLVAFGLILHDVPEGFVMANSYIASPSLGILVAPAIALLGLAALHFHPGLNPLFMAFAAGAMVFVSVHELLPMARRYGHTRLFTTGAVGSALVYGLLTLAVPEIPD